MTIQQLNPQVTVYLTRSRNWGNWFPIAKADDLTLEIWDYVNSDNAEERVLSAESLRSAVSQVKADTMTIANLKEDELTWYDYLHEFWKKKKVAYEKTKQSLTLYHNHLHFIIDTNMIVYFIKNKDSLYRIMKILKEEYSMSIETCQKNILDQYVALKQFSKNKDLVLRCDKWLRIYNDFKEARIMKINAARHDFFDVNKKVDFFIASAYAWDYNELEFKTLVIKFKDYYKANPRSK